jgi:hypothetical protein
MKRLWWIVKHGREIWQWAGAYMRMAPECSPDFTLPLTDYVEFEVPGMVEPYDRMRLVAGMMSSCGGARMGMQLHVNCNKWGGWNGGIIDHKDLADIRDLINVHLKLIDDLPPDERYRLQQSFGERMRLKKEPISAGDVWPDEIAR